MLNHQYVFVRSVPISLKVSLDVVKLLYSFFIGWDLQLYDEVRQVPAVAANTAIPESLGQVDVILSDKTGTLTENRMIFRKCAVGAAAHRLFGDHAEVFEGWFLFLCSCVRVHFQVQVQ